MFANFQDENVAKKIAQSFLFIAKIITKSERFLSFSVRKMSKGFLKFCKLISNLILGHGLKSFCLTNVHKLAAITT